METIEKIIKTVKFCKEMGISYVEFDTNTKIMMARNESILLNEFLENNNCLIGIKEPDNVIENARYAECIGREIYIPKSQLAIWIR